MFVRKLLRLTTNKLSRGLHEWHFVGGVHLSSVVPTYSSKKVALIARFMGPTWGRQDPGGPHVGHVKLAVWGSISCQQLSSKTATLSKLTTDFTLHTYSKSYVWYLDMTEQDWVWNKYTLPSTPYCTTDVASKSPGFHPSMLCDSWQDVLRQDTSHRRPHEICTGFYPDCIYRDVLLCGFMWCTLPLFFSQSNSYLSLFPFPTDKIQHCVWSKLTALSILQETIIWTNYD